MHSSNKFWLAVGTSENWHTAFDYGGIWGLRNSQVGFWNRMTENSDLIFFYVTSPVSGVVGNGILRTKLHQLSPLWPEERAKNQVIWPFRVEFDVMSCLSPAVWKDQAVGAEELKTRVRSGFQEIEPQLAERLMKLIPSARPNGLVLSPPVGIPAPRSPALQTLAVQAPETHQHIQGLLAEIGRLQKFVVDVEFPIENRRVDVTWRRVQRSVPSYVFEVQVGGNLTEALAKLKHAYELWNSNIFLVGKPEHKNPSSQLCDGSFHEIKDRMRFLELGQVEELHRRKLAYRNFEDELGILG
jgi:predicted RNA-binding protein